MHKLFCCPQQHEWEISINHQGEAALAAILCPQCGSSAKTLDSPAFVPSNAEKSISGSEWPEVPGYEIVAVLGRGGMGVVYKARQLALNRLVALKMLPTGKEDSERLARFRGEAEAVARLQHPHIVHIYDVALERRPYLALEYVEGISLAEKVKGLAQPTRMAAALVEVLARAMDYAHTRGIIHRDLKPANILMAGPPEAELEACLPKLMDFGLAKQLPASGMQTHLGAILGTPEYMAPEQAEGHLHVTPLVDVYALGAILYELLTGRPPFRGNNALETLEQVRSLDPKSPRSLNPGIPRDLETIVLRCLEKAPGKRYPKAAALADDLRLFLEGQTIQSRPIGSWEKAGRLARRRPAAVLLLLTWVVVLPAFLVGIWHALRVEVPKQADEGQHRRRSAQVDAGTQLTVEEQPVFAPNLVATAQGRGVTFALYSDGVLKQGTTEQAPVVLTGVQSLYQLVQRNGRQQAYHVRGGEMYQYDAVPDWVWVAKADQVARDERGNLFVRSGDKLRQLSGIARNDALAFVADSQISGVESLYQMLRRDGTPCAYHAKAGRLYQFDTKSKWVHVTGADQVAQDARGALFILTGDILVQMQGVPEGTYKAFVPGSQIIGVQALYQMIRPDGTRCAYHLTNGRLYQFDNDRRWVEIIEADQVVQDASGNLFVLTNGNLVQMSGVPEGNREAIVPGSQISGVRWVYQAGTGKGLRAYHMKDRVTYQFFRERWVEVSRGG